MFGLYSIKDLKTDIFSPPMTFENDECAIDYFAGLVAFKRDNVIARCPDNFTLFNLGDFDDSLGIINGQPPITVAGGYQLLEKARELYRNYNKNLNFIQGKEEENVVGEQISDSVEGVNHSG